MDTIIRKPHHRSRVPVYTGSGREGNWKSLGEKRFNENTSVLTFGDVLVSPSNGNVAIFSVAPSVAGRGGAAEVTVPGRGPTGRRPDKERAGYGVPGILEVLARTRRVAARAC